jgi:hypothetical protein
MKKPDLTKRPKETALDVAHTVVKAALGSVPVVGSAASELFAAVVTPPIARRRDEWVENIALGLERLRAGEGLNYDELSRNDVFISTVLHATQAALRSHQQEKLDALRNAVLNSARSGAPDDDLQLTFLNLVDTFTPWHLRILAFLHDPRAWLDSRTVSYRHLMMGDVSTVLEMAFPELVSRRDFYDQVAKDLHVRGLLSTESLRVTMTADGMVSSRTTEMGKTFLKFISEPSASERTYER